MKLHTVLSSIFIAGSLMIAPQAVAQDEDQWGSEDEWGSSDDGWGDYEDYDDPYGDMNESESKKTKAQEYRDKIENDCENKQEYRTRAKSELYPYTYSNSKTSIVKLQRAPQFQSFVVPVYYDFQHSIVFNTEGISEKVGIKIYDGPKNDKGREVLFEGDRESDVTTFELGADYGKSKIYVEYLIPPSHPEKRDIVQKGCVVFVMGYLDEAAAEFKEKSGSEKK